MSDSPLEALQPPPELFIENVPAVSTSLASDIGRYNDFRGHSLVDWRVGQQRAHREMEMLVCHRPGTDTSQLFRLNEECGQLLPLTQMCDDAVTSGCFEPVHGRHAVFQRSRGGNEEVQLYKTCLATGETHQITPDTHKHSLLAWFHASPVLLCISLPLDRTSSSGTRSEFTSDLSMICVDDCPTLVSRQISKLPGPGWGSGGCCVSFDDEIIAITRYVSVNESSIWLLHAPTGSMVQLHLAATDAPRATWQARAFSADNKVLFARSDAFSEFKELVALHLDNTLQLFRDWLKDHGGSASGFTLPAVAVSRISAHISWDLCGTSFQECSDTKLIAAIFNVDGRRELRMFEQKNPFAMVVSPPIPPGSVSSVMFHPTHADVLAVTITGSANPGQIYVVSRYSPAARQDSPPLTAVVAAWTTPYAPPGTDIGGFSEQSIIRFPSFDGRIISAIANYPTNIASGTSTARYPVLICIHGGPESQALCGFLGRMNYFIKEMGFAILQPNVRGSSGYGKTFLDLDNGLLREDSVRDIGCLLDWIQCQENLDSSRVVVYGGSYGGYMSLAVSFHYPERIVAAIDVVGISNFVTFLTNTESYRRDLRRAEYGDERDAEMREFLQKISPLNNVHLMRKPLLVVQGKNDPRVPYTESEQMVARLRDEGRVVWYIRADNEGHGFVRKANTDFQFFAMVLFIRAVVG